MYFKVHLTPESKRDSISRAAGDKFQITVKEKAAGNQANKKALGILAEHLKVDPAKIRIMSGHHSPHKIIHLRD
jgi:uncharacterized protein YggU (UPF0235/DUF167 family)